MSRGRGAFAMWFVLTAICAMGILFYLRFLVALCKEYRFMRIGYLVRLEPTARQESMYEKARAEIGSRRAA
ncbi:MAG: hypothetical protein WBF04_06645 [Candidatus Sulfotelmatobacter sp.]